jgi:hypothetical protein
VSCCYTGRSGLCRGAGPGPKHTWVTLPSRPLYFPRTIRTSSSFRMGRDRAVCCCRSSLLRGEDMIFRLRPEGAAK